MQAILNKILGSKTARDIKRLRPLIARMLEIEESYQSLSDDDLRGLTDQFKKRVSDGETLEDVMCEAFAAVKNACRRLCGKTFEVCNHDLAWDMIPYDVQLMGAIVLHQGKIAEMQTGEGKTLVATMPLYLNALSGKSVHLVTVNDYLARRDSQWMGEVFTSLGLTVGCIQNEMNPEQRRGEYAKDITYGTNSEFGFDYLRDNGMAYEPEQMVQRGHYYAIIDEIDSILIDEARTPLIISGPAPDETSHQYTEARPRVEQLVRKQRDLCKRLIGEARDRLEQSDEEGAQLRLYQVNNGMPKNKDLLEMIEDPAIRRLHEQIDAAMLTDMRKEQGRDLREELFFTIDEKGHDASLTDKGCNTLNPSDPDAYVLPDIATSFSELDAESTISEEEKNQRRQAVQAEFSEKSERIHTVDQLIRAYCVYEKDVQYVVQGSQVLIVDEFTGRIMPGRRWSDGLHQAIEAKEGVKIERETQTLATVTIQNYFRMYDKLAGMTGTAETEAEEFSQIYKLEVLAVETNRPVRRVDGNDCIYKTHREKFQGIIDEITDAHQREQPVLVGTISVETSELLSRMLKNVNIPHSVLNAKNHEREAEIVTQAGQPGAVTIATNMAGRGTDIKLGNGVVWLDRDVIESSLTLSGRFDGGTLEGSLDEKPCGLYVIGSERHESRRIDRQLRGRSARQGDPGSSRFYVSLEDDLMRLFGSEKIAGIMERLGLEEGQVLEHKWLNRSIETAQRRVEQHNFSIRKRTLEYDDVMNKQREIVYGLRSSVVMANDVRPQLLDMFHDAISVRVESFFADEEEDALRDLMDWFRSTFPIVVGDDDFDREKRTSEEVAELIYERVKRAYELKAQVEDSARIRNLEKHVVLHAIDTQWQDYLRAMDGLREGVGLRAYGQRDPLIEFKREAFEMFEELMDTINNEIVTTVFRSATSLDSFDAFLSALPQTLVHDEIAALGGGAAGPGPGSPNADGAVDEALRTAAPVRRDMPKVGRNDPCPCGSGKKYKKCCGANR